MTLKLLLPTAFLFLSASMFAAESEAAKRVYITLDAGGNITSKVQHSFTTATLTMEPGARFDIALGFNAIKTKPANLAFELETGLIYNAIDSATVNGAPVDADGYLLQVPILVNAIVRFTPDYALTPYIGIGGGAIRSDLSLGWLWGGNEISGAVQGQAGLVYNPGDVLSVGIGYKYLLAYPDGLKRTTNHSFLLVFGFNY